MPGSNKQHRFNRENVYGFFLKILFELVAIFTLHRVIWGFLDNFPVCVLGRFGCF